MVNRRFYFSQGEQLLVDKPLEWTSFDVVNKIRYAATRHCRHHEAHFGKRLKVGHAGTLDPKASGLLMICTGKQTRKINELTDLDKEYEGVITLGASRPSYDLETEIDQVFETDHISEALVRETIPQFIGEMEQIPPIYSAIKVGGQRVYERARKGEKVNLKSRKIIIHSFNVLRFEVPHITFKIRCSKGTYIRSIANDFGKALNSGAYLSALRRIKIGEFELENAWNLNELIEVIHRDTSDEFQ